MWRRPARALRPFYRGKYSLLLGTLLVLPIVQAAVDGHPALELGYFLAFVGMLVAATAVVGHSRHALWTGLFLGVPVLCSVLVLPTTGLCLESTYQGWMLSRTAIFLLFLGVLSAMILQDVEHSRRIMFDQVCGGLCVYLMIGYAWGLMYAALEHISPGAFSIDLARFGLEGVVSPLRLNAVMTYGSFVTLTTLGYGDIAPVGPMARGLVWVEAVLGQIYMAVFVARLVSQYLATGPLTFAAPPPASTAHDNGLRNDLPHPAPLPHGPIPVVPAPDAVAVRPGRRSL